MTELRDAIILWLTKEKPPKQPMPATEAAVQITLFICMTVMVIAVAVSVFIRAVCY